jgi:tetratricopeptide (TPR) repeat protein
LPSVGGYTLGDVARICGVPRKRLRYWQRTQLFDAPEAESESYGFGDLVTVRRVISLLEQGVPLRRIRRSIEALRLNLPDVDRPLGALRVWHEGSGRVVVSHEGVLLEPDGQLVLGLGEQGSEPAPVASIEGAWGAADEQRRAQARCRAEDWFEQGCRYDSDRSTFADAIEAYEKALDADPEFADAHCNLGTVFYNQERKARARACFERTLELDPGHLEAHLNLAVMLEEDGRQESALVHYKRALEADPLSAETHVSLALLYEKLGLRRTSAEHWRRYLQLDPAGPWSEVAKRHLEER